MGGLSAHGKRVNILWKRLGSDSARATIHFYGQLQRGPIEKLPRKILSTVVGLGFAMIAQFAILVVWIRYIYKFFWF